MVRAVLRRDELEGHQVQPVLAIDPKPRGSLRAARARAKEGCTRKPDSLPSKRFVVGVQKATSDQARIYLQSRTRPVAKKKPHYQTNKRSLKSLPSNRVEPNPWFGSSEMDCFPLTQNQGVKSKSKPQIQTTGSGEPDILIMQSTQFTRCPRPEVRIGCTNQITYAFGVEGQSRSMVH